MAAGKTAALLLAILCMAQLLVPASLQAASISALRVDTISHGVKLSLSIPRQTYPKNALVRVTVRLENVSRHTVLVSGNNPSTVVVFDSAHQPVYWADTPFFGQALFDHSVPRRPTIHLQPHQHLVNSFFVILRRPVLQAQATLGAPAKERGIGGAFVPLTLTDEAAPVAIVSDTPTVHATITPPPGVVGPPYFVEQTECPENETWRGWLRAATDTLTPGFAPECNANRKWIAYAGWLGHPITAIDYTDS